MRLQCFLAADEPLTPIPWEYPFALTAWVYRVLNQANPQWGDRAHAAGTPRTAIRPFAVSWLRFPMAPTAIPAGLRPASPLADFLLGTYDPDLARAIEVMGPGEPLVLGANRYQVLAALPLPGDAMRGPWRCLSPVVVSCRENGRRCFLDPADPAFWRLAAQNLAHKARQFHGVAVDPAAIRITAAGTPHRKRVTIHGHPILGWQWSGLVTVEGPALVVDVAGTLGLGVYNSNGFGALAPAV